ncbi:MAG: HEPN domain-containing protein [Candidatus Aenigmatarchaeota archaeon]
MDSRFEMEIQKARKEYEEAIGAGQIKKSNDNKRFTRFFFERSENSLLTANLLYQISNNSEDKTSLKIDESYGSYMWVIVTCYYSMFYMASALISKKGVKVGSSDAHKNVKNAFLRLYIENSDLERRLGMEYTQCKEIAHDLMQERNKRSKYQYDVGLNVLKRDAEMSIKHAKNFFEKTRKVIEE